jgi:hypothetical protein
MLSTGGGSLVLSGGDGVVDDDWLLSTVGTGVLLVLAGAGGNSIVSR